MKTIGLDIGTSTLSAVVWETGSGVLTSRTLQNNSFLPGESWEHLQDPDTILHASERIIQDLCILHPDISALGISCQMHGILYLDNRGNAVSPLYTWQDERGNLPFDEHRSWAEYLLWMPFTIGKATTSSKFIMMSTRSLTNTTPKKFGSMGRSIFWKSAM